MGEIRYSSAPYAIWSEDMLRKKLDDLIAATEDLTIYIEEDFFFACLFKLCSNGGCAIRYRNKEFRMI